MRRTVRPPLKPNRGGRGKRGERAPSGSEWPHIGKRARTHTDTLLSVFSLNSVHVCLTNTFIKTDVMGGPQSEYWGLSQACAGCEDVVAVMNVC